ncbi:hypothetical protein D3C81_2071560 [compost metagenome]
MPDFVGDDISPREVTDHCKLLLQFVEKAEVEIHLLIARAIERATAGAGETTAGDHAVFEQRQGG